MTINSPVATKPTIGFNVEDVVKYGILLNFWDVGGDPMTRTLWRHQWRCTDAIIFVVDSSDHDTIDEAAETMYSIFEDGGEDLTDCPLLILCNKQDIPGAISAPDLAERFDLHNRVYERQYYCQATSGTSGDGCEDGLQWLAETLKNMQ